MKHNLNYIDIFMNNSCPSTCDHCAVFSNFNFKGHFSFEENQDSLAKWSDKLDIWDLSLFGGEPLLHPQFYIWVDGVRSIFKDQDRLSMSIGQPPNVLMNYKDRIEYLIKNKIRVEFNPKDPSIYLTTKVFAESFLKPNTWTVDFDLPGGDDEDKNRQWSEDGDLHYYVDGVNVIDIIPSWEHAHGPVSTINDGVVSFHKSDPNEAFENCELKTCHQYREGRIYRCPVTATVQDFSKQFQISKEFKDIIASVESIGPDDSDEVIGNFIDGLARPELACSLCNANPEVVEIFPARHKKIMLKKV
jgi:hypothetical protein